MTGLTSLTKSYIGGIVIIGGALVFLAVTEPVNWVVVASVAGLVLVADSAPAILLRSGSERVTTSVGFPIKMAAIVLTGPWGAIVATTVTLFLYVRGGQPVVKRTFNAAQRIIAAALAGAVYVGVGGHVGPPTSHTFLTSLLPFVAAGLTYYVVNTGLVTVIVSLTSATGPSEAWRKGFLPLAFTYLGYGPIGLLIAVLWSEVGVLAAVFAIGPILVARWAANQLTAEREAQQNALQAFARAVETKDFYTRGHSERVSRLSELMGRAASWPDDRVVLLGYAGLLHDVGKIRVPTSILQKSGPLTREEYAAVQLHPVYGQAMMRDVKFLDDVLPGILHHHERFDGAGYPMGLSGHEIPEFARMLAVSDALDSMTSTRSYRSATAVQTALQEIRRNAGSQFDPAMVAILDAVITKHGWQPTSAPRPADDVGVRATFDHDDPLRPVPVEGRGDATGEPTPGTER
ncbi:MAG: HD-GYP domain-containing protein [Streptosporangiales bacterium]